jgi:hypothetical protein
VDFWIKCQFYPDSEPKNRTESGKNRLLGKPGKHSDCKTCGDFANKFSAKVFHSLGPYSPMVDVIFDRYQQLSIKASMCTKLMGINSRSISHICSWQLCCWYGGKLEACYRFERLVIACRNTDVLVLLICFAELHVLTIGSSISNSIVIQLCIKLVKTWYKLEINGSIVNIVNIIGTFSAILDLCKWRNWPIKTVFLRNIYHVT